MQSAVSELIEIIHKEMRLLHNLLELVNDEQQTLLRNDAEGLVGNLTRQEALLEKADQLEKQRLRVTEVLSRKLRVAPEELSMSRLMDLVEEAHSTELGKLQQTLVEAHQKIGETNRNNELLIRQSMGYIARTLDVVTASPPQETTYERSGYVRGMPHQKPKMMDQRF
ncbi:MAG: flagellar protein FlgN [Candidatus Latescibacteria bacterium]|nr:flagellar protein FlgN [Candidatus Latescibacterota bacterium]MCK5379866.1 flagellar protein FlgN [Candidatus Latescibacterota bacterium]MCK5527174.1 flagellar protein FlgN [Candidatus Latescibacterota bacterium]MCK5734044.1 flagellar protein FlgN [Candidatus Latescibacterota bacterium]